MGLTSCQWITIAATLAGWRRVRNRHHAGFHPGEIEA